MWGTSHKFSLINAQKLTSVKIRRSFAGVT